MRSTSIHLDISGQRFGCVVVVGELVTVTVEVTVLVVGEAATLVDLVKVVMEIEVTVTLMVDVKVIVEATPGRSKFD